MNIPGIEQREAMALPKWNAYVICGGKLYVSIRGSSHYHRDHSDGFSTATKREYCPALATMARI